MVRCGSRTLQTVIGELRFNRPGSFFFSFELHASVLHVSLRDRSFCAQYVGASTPINVFLVLWGLQVYGWALKDLEVYGWALKDLEVYGWALKDLEVYG